jgi:Rap1a immunity proteins
MKRHAIAATLLLASTIAQAAGIVWLLGNDLARKCNASAQDNFALGDCAGYVTAVADIMSQPEWPYSQQAKACLVPEVERGQLVAVVKRYVAEHPEQLHYTAFSVVAVALAQAFPCTGR